MPAMVEKVHQRTGEDEQVGQQTEHVRTMLGEKEECGDPEEHQQDDAVAPRAAVSMVISVGHQGLLVLRWIELTPVNACPF